MNLIFDSSMPVPEQLMRASARKKVGRKHEKKKGPGKAATAAANKAKRNVILKSAGARRYKAAVKAYWNGEVDSHPRKPRK